MKVTFTSPVPVSVAVKSVHLLALIVKVAGEMVTSGLLVESVSVVPSVPKGAALKVNVAVPLTVNSGVVAVPFTVPVPNLAHWSPP